MLLALWGALNSLNAGTLSLLLIPIHQQLKKRSDGTTRIVLFRMNESSKKTLTGFILVNHPLSSVGEHLRAEITHMDNATLLCESHDSWLLLSGQSTLDAILTIPIQNSERNAFFHDLEKQLFSFPVQDTPNRSQNDKEYGISIFETFDKNGLPVSISHTGFERKEQGKKITFSCSFNPLNTGDDTWLVLKHVLDKRFSFQAK